MKEKQAKVAIIVAPNWKDYAKKYLTDCVNSLRKQNYTGEIKYFISDNKTSSESYSYISKIFPEAELVLSNQNDGFAKPNNECMKLAIDQNCDYLFLVNMDTITDKNCLSELIKTAEQNKKAGAIQARLMLWPETNKINSLGNMTHFLGFGYCLDNGQKINKSKLNQTNIVYPTGAAVLLRTSVIKRIGFFDEKMWMYNEDQDLGWRIWLAGFKCVLSPDAIVYHKYKFAKSIKQYYWMDRNRIISMWRNYHLLTLLLIFPAFLSMELGLFLFSFKSGWLKEKLKVYLYFLNPFNWLYLIKARQESQNLRKVKDKDIVQMFSGKIEHQELNDPKLKLINPIFQTYWNIAKKIIKW